MEKLLQEEQIHLLREKVMQSEQERLRGAKTISISDARSELRKRCIIKVVG